jgi:hypothetical protein
LLAFVAGDELSIDDAIVYNDLEPPEALGHVGALPAAGVWGSERREGFRRN